MLQCFEGFSTERMLAVDMAKLQEACAYFGIPAALQPLGVIVVEHAKLQWEAELVQARTMLAEGIASAAKSSSFYDAPSSQLCQPFGIEHIKCELYVAGYGQDAELLPVNEVGSLTAIQQAALQLVAGAEGLQVEWKNRGCKFWEGIVLRAAPAAASC